MEKKLILVTNDDSINASGVHRLIDRLVKYGDVVVVCPDAPRSGQSMALTVNDALKLSPLPDYQGAKMYKLSGTPVDCIKVAWHTIMERKPDLVVSGINHGSNASVNVLYSGTMGAAMEGCVLGIPSIGFSLTDHNPDADFTPCYDAVDAIVEGVIANGLPEGVCLNVNVPDISDSHPPMQIATPCKGKWDDEYKAYTDPHGGRFFWLSGKFVNEEPENPDTDEYCLQHGVISVVPTPLIRVNPSLDAPTEQLVPWLPSVVDSYNLKK